MWLWFLAPALAEDGQHRLTTPDGRERTWIEHAPTPQGRGRRPLVIALHGGGGSASQLREHADLDAVGDALGAVVVYPDGTPGPRAIGAQLFRWDAGPCCLGPGEAPVDDVGFLVTVVSEVSRRERIDPQRVVLIGHSNGAMMAERALCERPDVFAGAVLVGSPGIGAACAAPPARPVVVVHGERDTCATFGPSADCGGCWEKAMEAAFGVPVPRRRTLACDGAEAIAGRWRGDAAPAAPWTAGGAACERWDGDGPPVSLCRHDGGHLFPSGGPPCAADTRLCTALVDVVGPTPSSPVAMEAVLRELLGATGR